MGELRLDRMCKVCPRYISTRFEYCYAHRHLKTSTPKYYSNYGGNKGMDAMIKEKL